MLFIVGRDLFRFSGGGDLRSIEKDNGEIFGSRSIHRGSSNSANIGFPASRGASILRRTRIRRRPLVSNEIIVIDYPRFGNDD